MTVEHEVTLNTADGPMPAFVAKPEDVLRGGIVVVQEAFGVTEHIREIARRLAREGWYAIAPAFFHRQGSPVFAYDDVPAVLPVMSELTAKGLTNDVESTIDHLQAAGISPAQIGVIGFCMGGSVSFFAATLRPIGAAVTFYGGGIIEGRFGLPSLIELTSELKAPWLGLYGDLDQGIPAKAVERLRKATEATPVPTRIISYPDADHGFNCNDRPAVFNADAAAEAWLWTVSWFDEYLVSRDESTS
jgi:carboxymethylenebutenolidase